MDISDDGKSIGLETIYPRSTPQEAIDAIISELVKENELETKVLQ